MQRFREALAGSGTATLAFVFALAFATFYLASAVAQVAFFAFEQHAGDGFFQFHLLGTQVQYAAVLQDTLTLLALVAALFAVWRLTRGRCASAPSASRRFRAQRPCAGIARQS